MILAIALVSGIWFVITFAASVWSGMENGKDLQPNTVLGAVFVLSVWESSLTLGIIGLVFVVFSLIINILIEWDS